MYYLLYIHNIISSLKLYQTDLMLFVPPPSFFYCTDFSSSSSVGILSTLSCFALQMLCIVISLSKVPIMPDFFITPGCMLTSEDLELGIQNDRENESGMMERNVNSLVGRVRVEGF